MSPWVLGIDVGTQSLKVVLADSDLKIAATASRSYDVLHLAAGGAEQNPLDWEAALSPTIQEVLIKAKAHAEAVTALAVTGQLDGCIAMDHNGAPMGNALIWMDQRASSQHMAPKIAWLKAHGKANGARCFHQPVSYLVSRLTGCHVMDHMLASTTLLYSMAQKNYDADKLRAFGIAREELPEIADANDTAGALNDFGAKLTGLRQGTRVAVGTGDDFASALGSGLLKPGRLLGVLGTAEVVGALSTQPKLDPSGLVETHPFVNGTYFIENPGWVSGGALAWFQKIFQLAVSHDIDALAAQAPAGSNGLLYIPEWPGASHTESRACFYGLSSAHGRPQMARAVLEGCAFTMRAVLERLQEMQVPIESILLSGGGAKSALWAQIRADVCGLPVYVCESKESAPIGAAMLAASNFKSPNVGHAAACFEPHFENAKAYQKAYSQYQAVFQNLKQVES